MEVLSARQLDPNEIALKRGEQVMGEFETQPTIDELIQGIVESRQRQIASETANRSSAITNDREKNAPKLEAQQTKQAQGFDVQPRQEVVTGRFTANVMKERRLNGGDNSINTPAQAAKVHKKEVKAEKHARRNHRPGFFESMLLAEGYGRSNYRQSRVGSLGARPRSRSEFQSFREMLADRDAANTRVFSPN